jgi:hypothetical protein
MPKTHPSPLPLESVRVAFPPVEEDENEGNTKKQHPPLTKTSIIMKWVKGMICGSISTVTCCMCCGCCGRLPAPDVFYDPDDEAFNKFTPYDKRALNGLQWCSISGLCCRYATTCGCCCGCCGHVTPAEMVNCANDMKRRH